MKTAFGFAVDIFAVIGLLWMALTIFFAVSDTIKARGQDN